MTPLQEKIITEARTWLGTPYRHNQAAKHLGIDCVQFARVCCEHVGIPQVVYENYYQTPIKDTLLQIFKEHPNFQEIAEIEPGCVLVFRIAGIPHHIGIATSTTDMIHTDFKVGVVEHPLGDTWHNRIVGLFRVLV